MTNESNFLPWKQASGGALLDLERKTDRALAGLIPVSQNVYNLILRDYYEGKYTGWKRGLIFDGFLDGNMIESLSEGFGRSEAGRCIYFDGGTADYQDSRFGRSYTTALSTGQSLEKVWSGGRLGWASAVRIHMSGHTTLTMASTSGSFQRTYDKGSIGTGMEEVAFPFGVELDPGDTYRFTLTAKDQVTVGRSSGSAGFGYRVELSPPRGAATGALTSKPYQLGFSASGLNAWVRRSVAAFPAKLSILHGEGWIPLDYIRTEQAYTFEGAECFIDCLTLPQAPVGLNQITVRLEMEQYSQMPSIRIFDYAMAVL